MIPRLELEILSKHSILTDDNVCEINTLIKQLSPNAMCVKIDDILEAIAGGASIAVTRDYSESRNRIVGMATLIKKHQLTGFYGFIGDAVHDVRYDGHGITAELIFFLIKNARQLNIAHLDLSPSITAHPDTKNLYDLYGYIGREARIRHLSLIK